MHFIKVYTALILVLFTLKMHPSLDFHDETNSQHHQQPTECESCPSTSASCHNHSSCCHNFLSKKCDLINITNKKNNHYSEYNRFIPDVTLQTPFKPPADQIFA